MAAKISPGGVVLAGDQNFRYSAIKWKPLLLIDGLSMPNDSSIYVTGSAKTSHVRINFNFILLAQLVPALNRYPYTVYHVAKLKRSALLEGA